MRMPLRASAGRGCDPRDSASRNSNKKQRVVDLSTTLSSSVGITGFEPVTPNSRSWCANRTALHPVVLTMPRHRSGKSSDFEGQRYIVFSFSARISTVFLRRTELTAEKRPIAPLCSHREACDRVSSSHVAKLRDIPNCPPRAAAKRQTTEYIAIRAAPRTEHATPNRYRPSRRADRPCRNAPRNARRSKPALRS